MATTPTQGAPGVSVNIQLSPPTPPQTSVSPSVCGFIGEHWFGIPNKATVCNSWADFQKYFGGFNTSSIPELANAYLPYAVYEFFLNGGQVAQVARIAASAVPGAAASATLVDSTGTPQQTLKLTAGQLGVSGNIGTWGNSMYWAVTSMPTAGRFTLQIFNGSLSNQNLVETWTDMSMSKLDSRYAPALLNSPTSGSLWVFATDMNDVDVFPYNAPAVGNGQFSGGIDTGDPSVADRANAVTLGSGTSPFDYVHGPLSFAMPGELNTIVREAAILYSNTRSYTFFVIDPTSGETPSAAVAEFTGLSPIESTAAMYYPWMLATNPASSNLRSTILLPPSGFVLGQFVTTDNTIGPWKAPAGLATVLTGVVQAERTFSPADLATLNNSNVNALRTLGNGQVVIWGTRTMQSGYASLYVPVQRTLNYIASYLAAALETNVFAPNSSLTWATVTNTCTSFLTNLFNAGAFPGTTPAQSFYVICNSTNNTQQSIAQGVLNVTVGLALLYPIEFIVLTLAQFQSNGSVSVSQAS